MEWKTGRPFAPYTNTLLSEIAVRNCNQVYQRRPDPRSSPLVIVESTGGSGTTVHRPVSRYTRGPHEVRYDHTLFLGAFVLPDPPERHPDEGSRFTHLPVTATPTSWHITTLARHHTR